MPNSTRFSKKSLEFLNKSGRQKSAAWLDKNFEDYETYLLNPIKNLAQALKSELSPLVPHYHFPQKGIARIRRSARSQSMHGGGPYKDWMSYSASRPRESRFETNPNIFFLINTEDPEDPVLIAGGLYMPSSKQMRAIREAIARDATPFEKLFKCKDFIKSFKGGFSDEKISSRPPRGFDPAHPQMHWLKLQAFFVWKPYTQKEYSSARFTNRVVRDARQIIRLNALLEQAIRGTLKVETRITRRLSKSSILKRIHTIQAPERRMDF